MELTIENLADFIKKELPFNDLKIDTGIAETNNINNTDISIGVSYERDENGNNVFIYNLFAGEEYINISNKGTDKNKMPNSVLIELKDGILEVQSI